MRVSEALSEQPGVTRAAAVMATPLNLSLLADDGLLPSDLQASPEDLIVAVLSDDSAAADAAIEAVDGLLQARPQPTPGGDEQEPRRLVEGAQESNIALIAVPGQYAAIEAYAALRANKHVFLFSDNVSLEDEIRLKELAASRDLLMMGPDCGTAIIDGIGLGFANRVARGPVGIVGASGTGIQQICCLLDSAGVGIAQAIGTGGRDLSSSVGASMTRRALWILEQDDAVEVIAVVSKPGDADVARRLHGDLLGLHKPAVVCLLGATMQDAGQIRYARNLTEAAGIVVALIGGDEPGREKLSRFAGSNPGKYVYGLFAGGTLRSEAAAILDAMNAPHRLVDLGDDEYTRGRAHPIIDPRLRVSMLNDLAEREDAGAILLDVILGDLAHPDPASALLPAIHRIRSSADPAPIIATLVGARRDPQGLERQRAILQEAGVHVFAGNVAAATAAGRMVGATA